MRNRDIESAATDLQVRMWHKRDLLWPAGVPEPISMLAPEIAAFSLGVNYEVQEQLGRFGHGSDRYEVAGMIDRTRKLISVSRQFRLADRRFTAAHEIGHWVLHSNEIHHRDRPVKELTLPSERRPTIEREADYFAACFLVPVKLLTKQFKARFGGRAPLEINDATAFLLNPQDPDAILRANRDSLEVYFALASARHYSNCHFHSLHEYFGVSVMTMAIRLKELRLVAE